MFTMCDGLPSDQVDPAVKGKVELDDGSFFENPERKTANR